MSATTFEALGTYVFLASRRPAILPPTQRLAAAVLSDVDRTCSRFREDSDLTRANRQAGSWVAVDPLLVAAVRAACSAAEQTGGLVHPLLGRPLVQLGYDRDYDELHVLADQPAGEPTPPGVDSWREIGLDDDGALRVPAGTALDLGATAKAWAADLIAAAIAGETGTGAIVSLGGDIAIAPDADGEDLPPWPIEISTHPGDPAETTVALDGGGLATSSTQVRRWARAGVHLHHVLDPRTGRPADPVWHAVTATGPSATAANTASTASIVLGADAPGWLEAHDVTARLVAADGRVVTTGSWPDEPGSSQAAELLEHPGDDHRAQEVTAR
ncbi:FAD:protein FMN transferase [Nocardioides sp.]|uniref:FAD:protein FMN transferase n=1 Tax=Nocardioides sp. TaxID=35761 RepID=UPI0035276597